MYGTTGLISNLLGAYHMSDVAIRYSLFMPQAYNLAISLGFERGKIMPSRAFCSDESQGYPIILIAKHFGSFPFNHGRVGGIMATDRHAPHAQHGKDLVIIQASHVGYDLESGRFGVYRRLQTEDASETTSCGKICNELEWYMREFEFARENIHLYKENDNYKVIVDNLLLHEERQQGLMLKLDKLVKIDGNGNPVPELSKSTAKVFSASAELVSSLTEAEWNADPGIPIGQHLNPDMFYFKRDTSQQQEGRDHLENNLLNVMPYIVASKWPALTAAQANTQVEFDRAFRSIINEPAYRNKKILFISGLNVDISPLEGQVFPLTKFIPWAAFVQDENGNHQTWEQAELYEQLMAQSTENPDQLNLETAIETMESMKEVHLPF